MKKLLILITITLVTLMQFANADELVCRGVQTTMTFTDVDGVDEANFVFVRVWDARYDGARYAGLYSEMVHRRTPDVSRISSLKSFSSQSKTDSSSLSVDFTKKILSLVTKNGFTITEKFNCTLEKRSPVSFNIIGG